MAASTVAAVRLVSTDGIGDLSDSEIQQALDDAALFIGQDGWSVNDSLYELAHRYYALHLLVFAGVVADVTSESQEGVSQSYAVSASVDTDKRFKLMYDQLRTRRWGFGERVAANL